MADNKKKPRRRLWLVLGIVLGIVIYALAVDRTGVSLDEITSETRQAQLVRIIRALARPELVTYDFEDDNTDVDFFIPCVGDPAPITEGPVTVDPSCGEPEEMVTVTGSGFDPFVSGRIQFIPDSEFEVTLPLAVFEADGSGNFTIDVELPDRFSDSSQILRVQVPNRLGTWRNRQQVWTDTNENGVRDEGTIGSDGLTVSAEGISTDVPAIALLDATSQVTEFVTTGEGFVATDGPANGTTAVPIEETEEADITITSIETEGDTTVVNVSGPEGSNVSSWRIAVYDGLAGSFIGTAYLGDQIELSPRVSEQATLTLEAIVDTVFLALVATTAGLAIALPLSFVSARNLMKDVSTTVVGLGLGLIAIPVGIALGLAYMDLQRWVLSDVGSNTFLRIALVLAGGVVTFFLARQIFFGEEIRSNLIRTLRSIATMIALALALEGLFGLLTAGGEALEPAFGVLGFVPALFATIGEVGTVLLPFIISLIAAAIVLGVARRTAHWLVTHESAGIRAVTGYTTMAIAGAIWAVMIGAVIDWLYQIANPMLTVVLPAILGVLAGLVIAYFGRRQGEVRIGLTVYYVARTIFNTLRSIEPLVMVIVFVVWVGFGEFAGALALALHTAAALAKLYSEQVESISEGPLEAVRATGANRLQSIVYAVAPQIVPPYISFTMYRWDINVRMSTILGFAGGGGIGFLLQQNVALGDYRAASVQMLAIAIVVATMDYFSSKLRQRFT
ncbi:MAG TPA: ABC transporter permease subunit [Acidimicrobiia bacterium]|nr:ABC transporter permease subunit [Acidimicrobiia bacterium]